MTNRDSYNAISRQWDNARTVASAAERQFVEALLKHIPAGERVLDLGCGTGRPIAELVVNMGFTITGVDQSEKLLAIARERLPQCEWIESTLEAFVPDRKFSAAIAWDSLFHIAREHHAPIFAGVYAALEQGAGFMLTVGGSAGAAFTDQMFGHDFHYDSHTPEEAMQFLTAIGFEIEHSEFLNVPTSGRDKGRFAILARKSRALQ